MNKFVFENKLNLKIILLFVPCLYIIFYGCEKNDSVNGYAFNTIVYSQLSQDPTSEVIISWITENTLQSNIIEYKQVDASEFNIISSYTKVIPESDNLRLHTAYIPELSPDTKYQFKVAGEDITRSFKTLPSSIPYEGLKVAFAGDPHYNGKGHNLHDQLTRAMSKNGIDILVGKGDYVDCEGIIGFKQTNAWIDFFNMLDNNLFKLEDDYFYIPLIFAIGNHDTSPDFGTDPEAARYLRFFFENPSKLEPAGQNYGAITIGDYLQLIILDTWHTAHPGGEQKKWLKNVVDNSILHSVPVMHVTAFPTVRYPDEEVPDAIRREWFDIFYEAGNIRIAFDSHDHSWKRTVPLGISNEKPEHSSNEVNKGYFFLNDKYITQTESGIVFFGDGGWGSDSRPRWNPSTTWYLKDTHDRMNVYKTGISGVSNEYDGKQAGTYWEHIFIAVFKSDKIIVKSIDPTGNVFHKVTIDDF